MNALTIDSTIVIMHAPAITNSMQDWGCICMPHQHSITSMLVHTIASDSGRTQHGYGLDLRRMLQVKLGVPKRMLGHAGPF